MNSRDENSAETNGVPENVLRRVRALRDRAEHKGTPEAEREASRKLAAGLLARYSISTDLASEEAGKAAPKETRRPTTSRHAFGWIRLRLVELIAVAVPLVLAVTVSLWFLALAALVSAWWAAVEYRVARSRRQRRSAG